MATKLDNTGERMIPEHHKGKNIYGAHIGRYQAGLSLVKNKTVLDIASGSGYGTKLMASGADHVYGVDVDSETIDYAKENYGAKNITYLQGDGIRIPLEDNSVEIVVSYETIEHIKDYEAFMKEIRRVLKPKGMLLLSTPNDVEYGEGNHFHFHEFTYKELKSLVKKYFKYHRDYFQTLWLYSSIVPEPLQNSEWEKKIHVTNTVALKPEQCIYFFLLCSNEEITESIEPQGVIGEHYRQRDQQEQNNKRKKEREELKLLRAESSDLRKKHDLTKNELENIYASKSWKVARLSQITSRIIQYPFIVYKQKNSKKKQQ